MAGRRAIGLAVLATLAALLVPSVAIASESLSKNHLDRLEAAEPEGRSHTKWLLFAQSAGPSTVPAIGRDDGRTGLAPAVRRFALAVGANDGGSGRTKLRYAGTDAAAVAKVLVELGGVAPGDRVLLLDPDRRTLESNFESMARRMAAARATAGRVEFVFYYSGHSDEEGLLLRGEHFRYPELRQQLQTGAADVRIAILDSCASGAFTRDKGGVHRAPFLVDASAQVKGHAYLTSASAHEAAQESDRLRASFFTHALLTGLRGAADVGRKGRVTLNEAYHFAFQETLARTERTLRGPQHPNFDIQLVGSGDLVMTDLRGSSAGLRLEEALSGRVYVRDGEGTLVAELAKPAGRPVVLGLDPGMYRVTVDSGGQLAEANLTLVDGWRTELTVASLTPLVGELTASRGDGPGVSTEVPPEGTSGRYRQVPFNISLFPDLSLADAISGGKGGGHERLVQRFAVNLTLSRSARLDGFELSTIAALVDEDARGVELAGGGSSVGGRMTGLQAAVAGNVAGQLDGVQLAGGVNGVRGDGGWLQGAVGLNWTTGSFEGAQVAGGVNWANELDGLQLSSGVNVARERAEGVQLGAILNWAPRASGLQLGTVNHSREFSGSQIAVVNVGGDVSGLQLGIVNVATGSVDAQLGIVNVADDAAAPIGVFSYSRTGLHRFDIWASETMPANVSLRFGGRHVYGVVTGGAKPGDDPRFTTGLGVGVFAEATEKVSVSLDALVQNISGSGKLTNRGGGNSLQTARLGVGFDLGPVTLIGGPTYNLLATYGGEPEERVGLGELLPGEPFGTREWRTGKVGLRGWPGVFLGTQL